MNLGRGTIFGMKKLLFSTGNADKFFTAQQVCKMHGIEIVQRNLDILEIQDENPEKVAMDKAMKAYLRVKEPVLISDDSWAFLGLNGFPGVYMHSMNEWFTAEDFLRLVLPLEDRRAIFTQYLVYDDGNTQKVFTHQSKATLLREIRGTAKHPSHTVISMDKDKGKSIAEVIEYRSHDSDHDAAIVWNEFAQWYKET